MILRMLHTLRDWIIQIKDAYIREFKIIMHDPGVLLFFLFLPLVYPIIYSLIYNPEVVRDVSTVVVDHDRTPESRRLARMLDATPEVWVAGYAPDLHAARRAMDSHKCYAILEIPEGFGRRIGRGEQANSVMYCEMSLLLRYRGYVVATVNVAEAMGARLLHQKMVYDLPEVSSIAVGNPMPIESVMMGNTASGFDSFLMPGVLILIMHQCIILAVGMLGGAKRERRQITGYRSGILTSSVTASMTGQTLCYSTWLILPVIFLIHYVPLIFGFPMAGNVIEIFAFLLPMFLACVMLGLCLQGVVWEREAIFLLWVATSVAMVFLSGLTWPRYAIHGFWKVLSDILPATWGVEGFLKINGNGATIGQVDGCYAMLWILAAAYGALAYVVQRWVVRPTEIHPAGISFMGRKVGGR